MLKQLGSALVVLTTAAATAAAQGPDTTQVEKAVRFRVAPLSASVDRPGPTALEHGPDKLELGPRFKYGAEQLDELGPRWRWWGAEQLDELGPRWRWWGAEQLDELGPRWRWW